MYIGVIPYEHSIDIEPLWYFVGEDFRGAIHIGSIVEIPLGNGIEYGVVARVGEPDIPKENIKSLVQVIASNPILSSVQVELIILLSRRYCIPIHRVLAIFLPKSLLRSLEKSSFDLSKREIYQEQSSSRTLQLFLERRVAPEDIEPLFDEGGTIVVFPDDILLTVYKKYFSLSTDIAFLPSNSTSTRRVKVQKDMYSRRFRIIFGTRRILYYNLSAYKNILYLEDSFASDYFHYPIRIGYLDILRNIADISSHDITVLTSAPSIALLSNFKDFSLCSVLHPHV